MKINVISNQSHSEHSLAGVSRWSLRADSVGGLRPLSLSGFARCTTDEAVVYISWEPASCCLTRVHRAGGGMAGWGGFFFSLLNYKTEKYVIAENRRIGILFRLYQLAVLGYIIG